MILKKEFEGYRSTVQGLIESSGNRQNLVTTVLALIPGAGVYSILRLTCQSPDTITKESKLQKNPKEIGSGAEDK